MVIFALDFRGKFSITHIIDFASGTTKTDNTGGMFYFDLNSQMRWTCQKVSSFRVVQVISYNRKFKKLRKNGSFICTNVFTKAFHFHLLGWKNMAAMLWSCHDHIMIMAKHAHDQAIMTAWRPCFLVWSSSLPWFTPWSWCAHHVLHVSWKVDFLNSNFSKIVATIVDYMAHLTVPRGTNASKAEPAKMNEEYSNSLKSFFVW